MNTSVRWRAVLLSCVPILQISGRMCPRGGHYIGHLHCSTGLASHCVATPSLWRLLRSPTCDDGEWYPYHGQSTTFHWAACPVPSKAEREKHLSYFMAPCHPPQWPGVNTATFLTCNMARLQVNTTTFLTCDMARLQVLLPGAGEAPGLALQRAPAWVLPALPVRLEKPLVMTVPNIITTSAGGGDVTAMCRRVSTCGRRLTRSSATLVTLSHLHTSHRSQLDPS